MRRGRKGMKRVEEATSRAQPRPVCNLPNDLSPGLIITVVPSPTKQSGGILFKNNCVPSCDGFLCLITANCSEFTSIMARLTCRLCNTGECGRKKVEGGRGTVMSSRRQLQFLCALVEPKNPRLVTRIDLLPRFHEDFVPELWDDLSYSPPSLRLKEVNFVNVCAFYFAVI